MSIHHEITMTNFQAQPDEGNVSVEFDWNGAAFSATFQSPSNFYAENADLFGASSDAIRFLLAYLLLLGETIETLPSKIGKKITIDINNVVQQAVSLTTVV